MNTKQPYTHVGPGLPPLYGAQAKALILGSFPSPKSRAQGFYYGHPQNRFWPLMATLTHSPTPAWEDLDAKRAIIIGSGLAVWDVIHACSIRGASDASIKDVEPNDLAALVNRLGVQAIFCNGATSGRLYRKYAQPLTRLEAVVLPSTSPANAAFTMPRLLDAWGTALEGYVNKTVKKRKKSAVLPPEKGQKLFALSPPLHYNEKGIPFAPAFAFAGAHLTTRSFEPMSKWIEKRTRPVLPLYLAALTWPVASLILPPYRLVNLVIIAALSTVVYLVSSRFCPTRVQRVEQPYATGSENTDAMLNGIAANLDALHKLNDAIPDAELSRQLDRMEKAGRGIVQAVEQKPDKARTVDRFARYYLPEVVKIMSAYAQMEKGGITGENAAQILSEVRRNAGTMATAFENQLDALYSAEAMDISTDIEVLENIMRGQNLT